MEWKNTKVVLDELYQQYLICPVCEKKYSHPKLFIECEHIVCSGCISKNQADECPKCHTVSDLKDLIEIHTTISHLDKISECINHQPDLESQLTTKLTRRRKPSVNDDNDDAQSKLTIDSAKQSTNTNQTDSVFNKSSRRRRRNDINKPNGQGETKLHVFCKKGKIAEVKKLLEQGADPNTRDFTGYTPLSESIIQDSEDHNEIVRILLESGVDPNVPGIECRTALHEAVLKSKKEIIQLLLKYNASTEVFDDYGKRPIDYSTSDEITNLLKEAKQIPPESLDETITFANRSNSKKEPIFYHSSLTKSNFVEFQKIVENLNVKTTLTFDDSVTHIFINQIFGGSQLSLELLKAILLGKWIITSECLSVLSSATDYSDWKNTLELFDRPDSGFTRARINKEQMKARLFRGCFFFFNIDNRKPIVYDGVEFTKNNLVELAKLGGGQVLSREPVPSDISSNDQIPFHISSIPSHSLYKCNHYVIYDPERSGPLKITYNMLHLKSLPLKWFIESISRFEILNPQDIGINIG